MGGASNEAHKQMTEPKPFKWALQLTGPNLDIEDALAWYAKADPMITLEGINGKPVPVLTSPQLDVLGTAREAQEVAQRLLALVNGVLFVIEPARTPLKAAGICERLTDGEWNFHLMSVGLVTGRSRVMAVGIAIVGGEPSPQHTRPSAAVRWSAAAQQDQVVADVLKYLSGGPDWFNFYKAFELMRDDINQRSGGQHRQERMGWPPKAQIDHFTLSANVYRHAPPWKGNYTPGNAMPLGEATRYIQLLASTWLKWRFP